VIFNSENVDEWAQPVRRRAPARPLPRGCHTPRRSRALRPLSGLRAGRPDSLAPPARTPRPARRSPDSLAPPAARLAPRAAVPAPVSRPVSLAVSRVPVGAAVRPPSSAAAACCAGRSSWAARAAPAEAKPGRSHVAVGHAHGPRQRCEHEHGPSAVSA
jgi:hypothetical protein